MRIVYPALHREYSAASQRGQATYINLIRADIAALIVGALASAINIPGRAMPILSAFALVVAIVIALRLKRDYARRWYDGRAGAESVKTLAWRFATRAKPFDGADDAARARLDEDLSNIAGRSVAGQATPEMGDIRARPLAERREIYRKQRIEDQRKWYGGKADENADRSKNWFRGLLTLHALAIGAAVAEIICPGLLIRPTGVLTAGAAAVLAWIQVKRFDELAQAYRQAAADLEQIALKPPAESEEQFSNFVADAENAISREHTLWVARRSSE